MQRQSRPPPIRSSTSHTSIGTVNTVRANNTRVSINTICRTMPTRSITQLKTTSRHLSTSTTNTKISADIPRQRRHQQLSRTFYVSNTTQPSHSKQSHPISDHVRWIKTVSITSTVNKTPSSQLNIMKVTPASPIIMTQRSDLSTHEDLDPHGGYERLPPKSPDEALKITIIDRENNTHSIDCKIGDNVLFLCRVLQEKFPDLYLEGACEASLGCSTCHVILDDKTYNYLEQNKPAEDDEEDMLDLASCLTPTSRLGCQVFLTKEMDGATITLPKFSRNFYVDGHIPQPH